MIFYLNFVILNRAQISWHRLLPQNLISVKCISFRERRKAKQNTGHNHNFPSSGRPPSEETNLVVVGPDGLVVGRPPRSHK